MKDYVMFNGENQLMVAGSVAQKLHMHGFNAGSLRPFFNKEGEPLVTVNGKTSMVANATLRKDEWKYYDDAVLKSALTRLRGISDLQARGLTLNIPNGMGKTVLEYETQSDITDAEVNMDGVPRSKGDRPVWTINYLPLPIVHKDFQINARALASSRETGQPLDTANAELAARKVAEMLETMLFVGIGTFTYGSGSLQGYLNKTGRNTYAINNNWDDESAVTGTEILNDVRGMKQELINDRFYGPYGTYIPTNFETRLDDDFKAQSDKTIRQRLLEVDGISSIAVADTLTSDNVVMAQFTSDVVRLVQGMQITTIQWDTEGGMVHNFKVMAIIVPQIRADYSGRMGLVHGS